MKMHRLVIILAMVMALPTFALSAAAEEALPYELTITKQIETKQETLSLYDYETDSVIETDAEVVYVSEGAELHVSTTIDLSAVVMDMYEYEDGVFDIGGPVYWTVGDSMSGLNFVEKDTTAMATFSNFTEGEFSLYIFDVWQEGMERTIYIKVVADAGEEPAEEPGEEPAEEQDDAEEPASSESDDAVAPAKVTALPTSSEVLVNGTNVAFESYNIGGFNYFKLRDIAAAVNDTEKQFEVEWDADNNAIKLVSGQSYTVAGGELELSGESDAREGIATSSSVYLDVDELQLEAYNIGGNNYFKLRDLAKALNIGITWDEETNTIGIETAIDYEE